MYTTIVVSFPLFQHSSSSFSICMSELVNHNTVYQSEPSTIELLLQYSRQFALMKHKYVYATTAEVVVLQMQNVVSSYRDRTRNAASHVALQVLAFVETNIMFYHFLCPDSQFRTHRAILYKYLPRSRPVCIVFLGDDMKLLVFCGNRFVLFLLWTNASMPFQQFHVIL